MRTFLAFFLIFLICFIVMPLSFASEVDSNEEIPQMDIDRTGWNAETVVQTSEYISEDIIPTEVVDGALDPDESELEGIVLTPLDIDRNVISGNGSVNVTTTVSPITPNNTNGFKSIILGVLGNYDPVIVEYAYQSSQGYTSYLREVQPDYAWMITAAIFLVMLYSVFRILGMVVSWQR